MKPFDLNDEAITALMFLRGAELMKMYRVQHEPDWKVFRTLRRYGLVTELPKFAKGRKLTAAWQLTKMGRGLIKAIVDHEEADTRYSAEEGPSTLLYRGALFAWSHSAALREIENLRRMRQAQEERKAKRAGRTGCHETRTRAAPRPKVAICVDDCRNRKMV